MSASIKLQSMFVGDCLKIVVTFKGAVFVSCQQVNEYQTKIWEVEWTGANKSTWKIYLHISIFAYFRKYWQEVMSWGNNWTLSSIKFKLWKNRYQDMEKFDEVDWSLTLLYLLSTLGRKLMSWPSVLYCVFLQLEGFFTKRGRMHLTETNSDYYF